jgi:hypothetical protein
MKNRLTKKTVSQSLFGAHCHDTSAIAQVSSPHTAADAAADEAAPEVSASLVAVAWTARRFFEAGAHTTCHEIVQSTGTVHWFLMVKAIPSSPLSD